MGIGSDIRAFKSQKEAEEAAKRGIIDPADALAQQLIEEQAPLRAAFSESALSSLDLLSKDASAEPGSSPGFQIGLQRGTADIMSNLSAFGLADSSASGKAVGEFTEGLFSRDSERLQNLRLRLAGFSQSSAQDPFGAGIGLKGQIFGFEGGLFKDLLNNQAAMERQKAAARAADHGITGSDIAGGLATVGASYFAPSPTPAPAP